MLVRSKEAWFDLVPELATARIAQTASHRAAHLSKGNLKGQWDAVLQAARGAEAGQSASAGTLENTAKSPS